MENFKMGGSSFFGKGNQSKSDPSPYKSSENGLVKDPVGPVVNNEETTEEYNANIRDENTNASIHNKKEVVNRIKHGSFRKPGRMQRHSAEKPE